MAREGGIEVEGAVVEALPHAMYLVELANGHRVRAHFKGKARKTGAEPLAIGEKVTLEMSLFDLSNGCIVNKK